MSNGRPTSSDGEPCLHGEDMSDGENSKYGVKPFRLSQIVGRRRQMVSSAFKL